MHDFIQKFIDDLPQQFRERERIEQLYMVIGKQFQEVYDFYEDLKTKRFLDTAEGIQLDRIGEILVLSRDEAKAIFGTDRDLTDDEYRRMLIYKTMMNYGNGTYSDIMSCIKILRGGTLGFRYTEDPLLPATIILETDDRPNSDYVSVIIETPIPKAAGVGIKISSKDGADINLEAGVTSQVYEIRVINSDVLDPDDFDYYTDVHETPYVDENSNLIAKGD